MRPVLWGLLVVAVTLTACSEPAGPDPGDPVDEPEVGRGEHQLLVERFSRSGQRSFYALELDGAVAWPFDAIPDDAVIVQPAPDGRHIAYLRGLPNGDQHIWVMDRDGSDARPVLEGERVVTSLAWSPDGQRLAYTNNTVTATDDVWVIGIDGSGAVNLTPDVGGAVIFDRVPVWSPDGSRIAFTSNRSGITRVWLMTPSGTQAVELTPAAPGGQARPAWSPDGQWLAFRHDAPAERGIAIARPDGSGFQLFPLENPIEGPVWSPDGRVLYTAPYTGDYEVYALDPATGQSTNLSRHGDHDLRVVPMRFAPPAASWRGFAGPVSYATGRPGADAVSAGDVTGDGRPDLVALIAQEQDVVVLAGSATGGFALPGSLGGLDGMRDLSLADVSRDGRADILVATPGGMLVWRGGAGGPTTPTSYGVSGEARALVTADFDRDGSTDAAIVYEAPDGEARFLVHGANEQTGDLVAILDYPSGLQSPLLSCGGDVTGEGSVDLVLTTTSPTAAVIVVPGQGDISFAAPQPTGAAPPSPQALLRCADMDGDRRADLVAFVPGEPGTLIVSRSTGTDFATPALLTVGGSDIAVADLDRDGDLDVLLAQPSASSVAFLRNLGDGRFAAPAPFRVTGAPTRLGVARVDGDDWLDLLIARGDGQLAVARNLGR